jgi:hypothetical protein
VSDERKIRVGLAFAAARGCVICRGPAQLVGMFQPTDSEAWGARPGKQRIVFYGLCDACRKSTSVEAIEAQLARGKRRAA